jgi:hypothetical protein
MRVLLLVGLAGCTRAPDRVDPAPTPPTPVPAPARCELDGEYRLRVGDPAHPVMWIRLRLANAKLVDASPRELAGYRVTTDREACTLIATREDGYFVTTIALAVNGSTVHGTERTSHREDVYPIVGERDDGTPRSPEPCFVPGIYELASDAQWACDPPERSFGMYTPFASFALRVQVVAGEIVIDRVDASSPHDPMLGDLVLARTGCTIGLTMSHGRRMTAKLAFHGDTFDGTVTGMETSGGDSGGPWRCRVASAKLTGTRVR